MNTHAIHDLIVLAQAQVNIAWYAAVLCILITLAAIWYGVRARRLERKRCWICFAPMTDCSGGMCSTWNKPNL